VIRLFAAIAVPDDIAQVLARRQQGLPGARWRPRESLHVTLRFFGEVSEATAHDLDGELAQVRGTPFELVLSGAGAFGEGPVSRAVWAGVEDSAPLRQLHGRCEAAARRAGLAAETRTFRPHLTLAYLRDAPPDRVGAWVRNHNLLRSPPFRVDRFGLYSSWRSHEGSRYELEREYLLA